ncbi:MAG: prolyl oligopeptidase family serine peptidase [Dehalococcoidia bacterium]|nr:prolyl oligopeptidase family serine peptidase [Dehalococcoidia bacterium]
MTKTHGVVVIHGQGEHQTRGVLLAELTNPIVDLLRQAGNEVSFDFNGDSDVPSSSIEVTRPPGCRDALDGDGHHIFEFREAFWDDAFPAPQADLVRRWAVAGLGEQIDGVRRGWWSNPTTAPSGSSPSLLSAVYRLSLIVLSAALMVMSVLTFLLLRPLAAFIDAASRTPGMGLFGLMPRIADAVAGLDPFMSLTLGDTMRFVTDGAWATNVRTRAEDIVCTFLDGDDVDDLTLIGYSAGAGVAYDILLEGRRVPRTIRERSRDGSAPKALRLLTIGSGLFHMWSFARRDDSTDAERRRLYERQLDPVVTRVDEEVPPFPFWTDLYARFDYIAAGAIRREIAERSGLREGDHYRSHRVVNYDHITDDHFGYFRNKDLAVPRVIAVLFGSDRWMQEGPSDEAAVEGVTYVQPTSRALSVFWLNAAKLLPFLVIAVNVIALRFSGWWHGQMVALSDAVAPSWANGGWVAIPEEMGVRSEFVILTVLLFVFFSIVARGVYTSWRPKVDAQEVLGARRALAAIGSIPVTVGLSIRENAPGYAILLGVVLLLGAAGLWYYVPAQVRDGALTLKTGAHDLAGGIEVVDVTGHQVALSGPRDAIEHPGVLGLQWEGGYGQVGAIVRTHDDRVVRRFIPQGAASSDASALPPRGNARLDTFAFQGDPLSARQIPFRETEYAAPSGPQRAWVVDGGGTWVIVVHGKGATRAEGLRILPTLAGLDLTTMLITYRNDRESILDPDAQYEYGATEWEDLEAAVRYALDQGASDIVLYGYSMGGSIVASFLERSELASSTRAVVLDAPMLDFAPTVDLGISGDPLIGAFASPMRVIAGLRLGIDWEELDYLDEDAEQLVAPILLFHGDADDVVPVETSRELASLRPELVIYVEVEDAGHTRAWNANPEAYEAQVREFLSTQLQR